MNRESVCRVSQGGDLWVWELLDRFPGGENVLRPPRLLWGWACLWGAPLMSAPRLYPTRPQVSWATAAVQMLPVRVALGSDQVTPAPVPSAGNATSPVFTLPPPSAPCPPTTRAASPPTASSQGSRPPTPPNRGQVHGSPGLDPLGGDKRPQVLWWQTACKPQTGLHGLPRAPAQPPSLKHMPPSGPRPALSFPPPHLCLGRLLLSFPWALHAFRGSVYRMQQAQPGWASRPQVRYLLPTPSQRVTCCVCKAQEGTGSQARVPDGHGAGQAPTSGTPGGSPPVPPAPGRVPASPLGSLPEGCGALAASRCSVGTSLTVQVGDAS